MFISAPLMSVGLARDSAVLRFSSRLVLRQGPPEQLPMRPESTKAPMTSACEPVGPRRKPHPIVKDLVLDSVAKLGLDLSP